MKNLTYKTADLTLKQAEEGGARTFSGYASIKGNIDLDGDMIVDGAYRDIPAFIAEGALLAGHKTDAMGIGMVTDAREDSKGLWVEGQFFDTPDAIAVYSKLKARMDAGKSCPMSFGFMLNESSWVTESGREYRKITGLTPKEASFVVVAANPLAGVAAIKGITGMPPDEQLGALLDGFSDWKNRIKTFNEDRKQGLSDARIEQLASLTKELSELYESALSKKLASEKILNDLAERFESLAKEQV